ncbi:3-oxoacyl-ACP reductase FabG [Sinorhizobium meliloti]|uniref:3-oxoacyl-ACP reductase FabG n=1 Tax=Rhizobium meliloti TaxID=382 RepID=UPI003D6543D3
MALVTGGGGGIGSAVCMRLAQEGALVVVTDYDAAKAQAAAGLLKAAGHRAIARQLDVVKREQWEEITTDLQNRNAQFDILVNVAGITRDRSIQKMSDADFRAVVDVSLYGSWLGCQFAVKTMRPKGWGRIVNFASTAMGGAFGQSNYSAAKAGLTGLTKTVSIEASRYGILVNAVAPGFINTEMTGAVPSAVKEEWIQKIALKRAGEPSEIASAVAFLASDDASYITGQTIIIDGGSTGA